jgi:hypothetical protein
VVEEDLREGTTGGMPDQDRRRRQAPDDPSRCSMIFGTVSASIGDGSALSTSTSTSKPGYAGARTVKPRAS